MREQITWACECGSTIKFSGLEEDQETLAGVLALISQHFMKGHEPVAPAEASLIRYNERRRRKWRRDHPRKVSP